MAYATAILCCRWGGRNSLCTLNPHHLAIIDKLQTQKSQDRQQCNGMYSRKAWGGDVDPFIETKFIKTTVEGDEDPLVSFVIFEWKDEELVGVWPSEDATRVGRLSQMNVEACLR